jgi:hypothetical protein
VQGIDDILRVVLDDVRVSNDGDPVAGVTLWRLDSVHREATGKTGNTSEDGLERLGLVMRDVVLEDWKHDPTKGCQREGSVRRIREKEKRAHLESSSPRSRSCWRSWSLRKDP